MQHLAEMSLYQILWYFLLYAFTGWCIEVVFCSVNTGKFVNRGFLNGPLCPIYGFGAVAVVVLLTPIQNSILLLYVGSVIVCSLLELVAGFLMKKLFHTTWWDYSDQPFNIGGYVCLKFSLLWGVACLVLMRVVHPAVTALVSFIPLIVGWILLIVLYVCLFADLIVTVAAVRHLNRDLGEISRLAQQMHQGSEALAMGLGNRAIATAEKVEALDLPGKRQELEEKLTTTREELTKAAQEGREQLATAAEAQKQKVAELLSSEVVRERMAALTAERKPVRERLLRAFPDMKNTRYSDGISLLRQARGAEENATQEVAPQGALEEKDVAAPRETLHNGAPHEEGHGVEAPEEEAPGKKMP